MLSCITRDSNVVDGDCSYNRRHETDQFKKTAEILPVSNHIHDNYTLIGNIRISLLVGYHEYPGGLGSWDHFPAGLVVLACPRSGPVAGLLAANVQAGAAQAVANHNAAPRSNPDLSPSLCSLHRTREEPGLDPTVPCLPLAEHRNASSRMVIGGEQSPADASPTASASAPGPIDPPPKLERRCSSAAVVPDNYDSDEDQRGQGDRVGKLSVRAYT